MSKVKDQMERDYEREMELYYSFMEFVCDQEKEVSENDVTKRVDEDLKKPSANRNSIVHQKALNNTDYNPNRSIK